MHPIAPAPMAPMHSQDADNELRAQLSASLAHTQYNPPALHAATHPHPHPQPGSTSGVAARSVGGHAQHQQNMISPVASPSTTTSAVAAAAAAAAATADMALGGASARHSQHHHQHGHHVGVLGAESGGVGAPSSINPAYGGVRDPSSDGGGVGDLLDGDGDIGSAGELGGVAAGARRELSQSKRAAQNRAAQRAFRQRKEGYIKKLEAQVQEAATLELNFKALQDENYSLREYIIHLQSRLLEAQKEIPPAPANIDLTTATEGVGSATTVPVFHSSSVLNSDGGQSAESGSSSQQPPHASNSGPQASHGPTHQQHGLSSTQSVASPQARVPVTATTGTKHARDYESPAGQHDASHDRHVASGRDGSGETGPMAKRPKQEPLSQPPTGEANSAKRTSGRAARTRNPIVATSSIVTAQSPDPRLDDDIASAIASQLNADHLTVGAEQRRRRTRTRSDEQGNETVVGAVAAGNHDDGDGQGDDDGVTRWQY